ncbi:MAG: S8 family peptidase [Acidimicrobiales bacterium]
MANDSVMFVSPSRPMTFEISDADAGSAAPDAAIPSGPPRVALLDGLPMANHTCLDGRLVVDDPDDFASLYAAAGQLHGTVMASLLAHGDLSSPGPPMSSPIYVRPILQPHAFFPRQETTPPDQLLVDLIDRCFHRMFEGDGGHSAVAPSIRIVNLSIGDPARMFVRHLSPLAKLLDWLAHRYNLVVVVSAGNFSMPPTVDADRLTGDPGPLREDVARRAHDNAQNRRLLSPAEAVNVVTIGATHEDGAEIELPDTIVDVVGAGLPAIYSPLGFGFRRSVKPEVMFPGGRRVHLRPPPDVRGLVILDSAPSLALGPGLRAAAPATGGDRTATSYTSGTSNAAALASRTADQIMELLARLHPEDGEFQFPDAQFHPVLAKALLVHAAGWGDRGRRLEALLGLTGRNIRRQLTQLLGYGPVDVERVAIADRVRATLVGASSITADARHTYTYPLPISLSATTMWRRLTITLAWLSPINTRSQKHRMARLSFSPPGETLGVNRTEADHNAVVRGTVQHEVLEGQSAVAFMQGDAMTINVDCRVDAGKLEVPVRYGIVVSLEVAEDVLVDIQSEVRTALRVEVQQRIRQTAAT